MLNELLNDFISCKIAKSFLAEIEFSEHQASSFVNKFGGSTFNENVESHDQVIENIFAKRIRKEVDTVATAMTRF